MRKIETFKLWIDAYPGLSVVLSDGSEILLEGLRSVNVRLEHSARSRHEEFVSDFLLIHKELSINERTYQHTSAFTVDQFLPLMAQQMCTLEPPLGGSQEGFSLEHLEGMNASSDSRGIYWIPVVMSESETKFFAASMKYFSGAFSVTVRMGNENRMAPHVYGRFSGGILRQLNGAEFSSDIFFKIPPEFLIGTNLASPRQLDEHGQLPTFESHSGPGGLILVSRHPWEESNFPVPMVWHPVE
ncbi:MAG: hypothetical protein ACFB21_15680 [Opitutales bacterium]